MSETAIDPSPTALATRLIERVRTSPATNTPGPGLEHVGLAGQRPAVIAHVGTGEDEAALVASHDALKPVGAGHGADEHEAGIDLLDRLRSVRGADPQRAQVAVLALGRDRLRAGAHLDVRQRRDLLDQVVGHRLCQRSGPHEHRDPTGVAAEVHGGWPAQFAPPITTTCWS